MAVIKQKSLKPATNVPHAEGILAYNDGAGASAEIPADALVYIEGIQGAHLKIALADSDGGNLLSKSALFVTKHRIPSGKSGVILPWKIIDFNTSGGAAGTVIYLHNDPTDTALPTGAGKAGGYKATAGTTVERVVGIHLNQATTANGGKALIAPNQLLGMSSAWSGGPL